MAYPWLMCLSHRLNPGSGLHSLLIGMHLCNPFQGCVVSEPSTGAPSALPAANVILPFPGKHPRIAPLQYFPAGKNPNLAGWLSVAIPPECGLSPISFPDRESPTFLREAHLASFVHLYIPIRSAHTLQAMPKAHFYAVKHIVIFTET